MSDASNLSRREVLVRGGALAAGAALVLDELVARRREIRIG